MSAPITSAPVNSTFKSFATRHALFAFFALAFAFTWTFMILDALGSYGILPWRLSLQGPGIFVVVLMGYGPTIAALIVSGTTRGRTGIRNLLGRLLIWRVGIRWYAAALVLPAVLFLVAAQLYVLLGGTLRENPPFSAELVIMLVVSLFAHALLNGEELGWRGFALPRIQARYQAFAASLILGIPWFLFHLPLFLTAGGGVGGNQANEPFFAFLFQVLSASVLATWLFNNTRGSVLLVILFHASANTFPDLFHSAAPDALMPWLQAIVFSVTAVIVAILFGAKNLSRVHERVRDE
jgi:membrane protease YdiL (CAAX protease family)